ncbi:MAG: hypothetical protein WBA00_17180 [Rhodococcus sp. (in: high G+C Gram-positive bacteria)]
MEIDNDRYLELSRPIAGMYNGYPPAVVVLGLAAIVGDDTVLATTSDRSTDDSTSTWRVAAVTESGVAYLEAVQDGNDQWEGGNSNEDRGKLRSVTGWLKPISTVCSIKLQPHARQFSSVTDAKVWYGLAFADGTEISLPMFGTDAHSREHESVEAVVAALRGVLNKNR